ncbi:MAG: alanyl-tRNA editing protein, partial [Anaerolineae bacterium]|nr:alanyl-tRNA editing protein [Anaerolineae bacterium]
QEFDAVITTTDGQSVTLDRTAFYPGGGGQPADAGVLSWEAGSARV